MPIAYQVDHGARIVVAAGHGTLTDADVFGYQRAAWSRLDVIGYNELIDVTHVIELEVPSVDQIRDLAQVAAAMDDGATTSRLAIVAPTDLAFGLGRMFQTYRQLNARSTKEARVFRRMEEALAFLRIYHPLAMPELP
jgi:hypothetical protein